MGFKLTDPGVQLAIKNGLVPGTAAPEAKKKSVPRQAKFVAPALRIEITVPVRLINPTNRREHHFARSLRVKSERQAVALAFATSIRGIAKIAAMWRVRLVRMGGRKWDDDGNEAGLKGVRDEVARVIGIDDGSDRIKFTCDWEPGPAVGVRIVIE